MNAVVQSEGRSVLVDMAMRFGMSPANFEATVRATCSPKGKDSRALTREEFAAFLLVAKEHRLNPLLREIYAYPAKGGGIVPVVGVDGWVNLVNSNQAFDGLEFSETHSDKGDLIAIECVIYRKDRARPTKVKEHLAECRRGTDAWNMPHRMLRHKALIQCARYAFGFSGIYDEEEAMVIAEARDVTPQKKAPPPPPAAKQITKTAQQPMEIVDTETGEVTMVEATEASRQRVQEAGGKGAKGYLDEDRADETQAKAVKEESAEADKAHETCLKELTRATEVDEVEGIAQSYRDAYWPRWTRDQQEEAIRVFSEQRERIAAQDASDGATEAGTDGNGDVASEGEASASVQASPPQEDFPGDTPAEPDVLQQMREGKKAADPAKKQPPKPPAGKKAEAPMTADTHPVNEQQYVAVFNARRALVKDEESARALKSWWFTSSSLRNSCGVSEEARVPMITAYQAAFQKFCR